MSASRTLPAACALLVAGCLAPVPGNSGRSECSRDSDCDTAAGEVCDEHVCWGNPPPGTFAAVLGPPSSVESTAAATELAALDFAPDGWFGDPRTGNLTLVPAVHVTGHIKAPCPASVPGCTSYLQVAAQVRWTRDSSLPGGERVTVPVSATSDGFDLYLPRLETATTYTVTIVPSTEPLGTNLPSPAQFLAPQRFSVTINPGDSEVGVVRDFQLGSAQSRTVTGRMLRGGAPLIGWRVHAEASDADNLGAFVLASNVGITSASGDFSLTVPDGPTVIDVVCDPPAAPNRNDPVPPSVRVRDHVVTSALPTLDVPAFGASVPVLIDVDGTNGSGQPINVAGAKVVATLDQELAPGTFLQYQASGTTTMGVSSLPLFLRTDGSPLQYSIDVLPGPASELASVYGVPLEVRSDQPAPPPIQLPRRVALVGKLLDDSGFALADTTITASVSGAALCKLSSDSLRIAKGLAPTQATTNAKGEFKVWLDPDLAGDELSYDLAVEPSVGTWAPRWTFVDEHLNVNDNSLTLWLPAAAHVRSTVVDAGQTVVPDTVVSLYQLTNKAPPCQQAAGMQYPGGVELRAIGQSDDQGVIRLILPRLPQ